MKRTTLSTWMLWATMTLPMLPTVAFSQAAEPDLPVTFRERNLSGPRLGVTFIPGNGAFLRELDQKQIGRLISQFGWEFERQIVPLGGGPQFVIQGVPMLAGVEYGKAIPSMTLAMGVRFPGGTEFGIGPSVTAVGGTEGARSALLIAFGRSFDYGGVSLPVNIALATNPKGQRVSLIVGYAVQRTSRVALR